MGGFGSVDTVSLSEGAGGGLFYMTPVREALCSGVSNGVYKGYTYMRCEEMGILVDGTTRRGIVLHEVLLSNT